MRQVPKSAYLCFTKGSFEDTLAGHSNFEWSLFDFNIQDFLSLSRFLAKEERPHARNAFNAGLPFFLLPHLVIQDGRVTEHAGRHRATVLLDNGYTTMPVRIFSVKNKDFPDYIKAQENAKDPDFTIPLPSPLTLDP
ncbi:MAG: hypothetical protein CL438_08640 [Acidimicrobiaceae bacterium]|nr:hypothetical protein [Acidimicrobiaceae bacterium]|tara:strand:+ start:2229 stop:2639 length:411 start_codon:yes stop_codon:yes gene_type:complete